MTHERKEETKYIHMRKRYDDSHNIINGENSRKDGTVN